MATTPISTTLVWGVPGAHTCASRLPCALCFFLRPSPGRLVAVGSWASRCAAPAPFSSVHVTHVRLWDRPAEALLPRVRAPPPGQFIHSVRIPRTDLDGHKSFSLTSTGESFGPGDAIIFGAEGGVSPPVPSGASWARIHAGGPVEAVVGCNLSSVVRHVHVTVRGAANRHSAEQFRARRRGDAFDDSIRARDTQRAEAEPIAARNVVVANEKLQFVSEAAYRASIGERLYALEAWHDMPTLAERRP